MSQASNFSEQTAEVLLFVVIDLALEAATR